MKNVDISSKPRKQRKAHFAAPLHVRQKKMAVTLSKELKAKYGKNAVPVRKGDTVKIMRGEFKGKDGKVIDVDLKSYSVKIENIKRRKTNGEEVSVPIHASNLMLIDLVLEDKKRIAKLGAEKTKEGKTKE